MTFDDALSRSLAAAAAAAAADVLFLPGATGWMWNVVACCRFTATPSDWTYMSSHHSEWPAWSWHDVMAWAYSPTIYAIYKLLSDPYKIFSVAVRLIWTDCTAAGKVWVPHIVSTITHSYGSARVLQGRRRKPTEKPKIWPLAMLKPLTDRLQTLHRWLGPPSAKFCADPTRAFSPHMGEI